MDVKLIFMGLDNTFKLQGILFTTQFRQKCVPLGDSIFFLVSGLSQLLGKNVLVAFSLTSSCSTQITFCQERKLPTLWFSLVK